jgi:hypothetical protein
LSRDGDRLRQRHQPQDDVEIRRPPDVDDDAATRCARPGARGDFAVPTGSAASDVAILVARDFANKPVSGCVAVTVAPAMPAS